MNGDSIGDVLIGVPSANNEIGQSYVIFGNKNWPESIDLSSLDGINGFTINGINPGDESGISVSGVGDVNEDGIDDILIGAWLVSFDYKKNQNYIIFGSKKPWPIAIELGGLNGINGFTIIGPSNGDQGMMGSNFVSGIGDVNGDNIHDILIGNSIVNNGIGQSYVIFGSKKSWPVIFDISSLNGTTGFTIDGINPNDYSGQLVGKTGDVNGDGIADILIGTGTRNNQVYIVFGSKKLWPAVVKLASLNGRNGFIISGSIIEYSVSFLETGDVNQDGLEDILIGSPNANKQEKGQTYVVFGSKESWPVIFNVANLDGINGFTINGMNAEENSGDSVSGVGDVNGDGIDDIIIGAFANNYVVFGKPQH